jgi:subtilisin family serine protease
MPRILVKAAAGLSGAKLALGTAAVDFKVEPLFRSIGSGLVGSGPGVAAGDTWYILTPKAEIGDQNPWDVCHSLLQQGFGVAGAVTPRFAEPDFEQRWTIGGSLAGKQISARLRDEPDMQGLARPCDVVDKQDTNYPRNDDNYWFRDADHSQFDDAIAAIGGAQIASSVRIAHFDTGYDDTHESLPKRLLKENDIQRNFVDPDHPHDATDRTTGLLTNLGHGTGTLGILAGTGIPATTALGGAPFAEIIPIRVANSVVLFSNSSIAKAFDYVHELNAAGKTPVDIITMSMGGLASRAWADAVNALYEQGVFIVTAAGNNFGNLPTRNIVYPARFNRVVAACGIMANGKPYADLAHQLMAGNYGPIGKMATAIAAPTPNLPWARLGCPKTIDFDGSGTSAATPQVAAAAAIWLQKNRAAVDAYPQKWMRVEAIRAALFASAWLAGAPDVHKPDLRVGRGLLRANEALKIAAVADPTKTGVDTVSFPILQILQNLGMQASDGALRQMLELEALQLSQNTAIESILPEDPAAASPADWRRLAEALASHPNASRALRQALSVPSGAFELAKPSAPVALGNSVLNIQLEHAKNPRPSVPAVRPLRVYAYDPSLGARLEMLDINEAILEVKWERDLKPGPVGEYVEVVDVDPASQCCYAPVDLNDPFILVRSGLTPSEASPQFHQQMAYAVSMKTIEHFEKALGRLALWAPREIREAGKKPRLEYVQRLRIYPHALRARNAYYSPEHKALLLGYFKSDVTSKGLMRGSVVFTAVSHDVVAHETTHALLDGVHRRFREATNPDVLSFHEAFADIVALFQHFTLPEALRHQIAATQGNLEKQNLLGQLAVQFGEATGRYGALRDYIADVAQTSKENDTPAGDTKDAKDKAPAAADAPSGDGAPKQTNYEAARDTGDPHAVGAVLVAAVFDAFLQIYKRRTFDLLRLATDGTGILPDGDISVDLVNRLAREASKVAGQMLNICIRALDYCPPMDIVFGEYLRALITADFDLVPNDKLGYRVAFIEAFRRRGIFPDDVKHLSPGSLTWEPPPLPLREANVRKVLQMMADAWNKERERSLASGVQPDERRQAWLESNSNAEVFWHWLMDENSVSDDELGALGLIRIQKPQSYHIGTQAGELRVIEVHSVRQARRVTPDGNILSDLIVEITQSFHPTDQPDQRYRGGCTLVINLVTGRVRYMVRKKIDSAWRYNNQLQFAEDARFGLRGNYFADPTNAREPFAMVHRVHG